MHVGHVSVKRCHARVGEHRAHPLSLVNMLLKALFYAKTHVMDHEAVCTTNLARVVSRTHKSCFVIVSDENCADMNMIHPW